MTISVVATDLMQGPRRGAATLYPEPNRSGQTGTPASSTLLSAGQPPAWIHKAVSELLFSAALRQASVATVENAVLWLSQLPAWIPDPSIGVGDDNTISIEWDRYGRTLHVMFEESFAEAYFVDEEAGEEWEMTLGPDTTTLVRALRCISFPVDAER